MREKSFIVDSLLVLAAISIIIGIREARGAPPAVQVEPWKIRGNPNAKVFIVEFSDFECPYCNKIRPVLKEVLDAYPNDLKIIFKQFPLSIHPPAELAAEASECAADQGRFWDYHDFLFDHVPDWYQAYKSNRLNARLKDYAGVLGLNLIEFRYCLDSGMKKNIVEENKKEGRHLFVQGTPTCILNGRRVLTSHKPEDIKKLVQAEIDKADRQ
jgi:protein-disulfide isomerase